MSTENTESFENLQERFGRFRILIIGPANSGKTTILRGICDSTENPEIYDGDGNKVDASQVEGSMGRGLHNVEDELVFRSNDKLIFHDSRGFEAGSKDEFLQMKKFVADRAKTRVLKKRIHAILYCIPMDKHHRAIQRAEEMFFDECDPGNVPVIVLFTKFDALLPVALGKLAPADRRLPLQERLSKAEPLIEETFGKADIWGRLSRLKYAPRSFVRIGGMHKSNEGCRKVLAATADALDEGALQKLLVSAQKVNIELCVRYAVQELVGYTDRVHKSLLSITNMDKVGLQKLTWWFPHVQEERIWWFRFELDQDVIASKKISLTESGQQALKPHNTIPFSTWKQLLQAGVDIILISEHSFFLYQKNDPEPFSSAAEKYKASDSCKRVENALVEVFKQYGKLSNGDKVDMVTNMILQNCIGTSN